MKTQGGENLDQKSHFGNDMKFKEATEFAVDRKFLGLLNKIQKGGGGLHWMK